MSSAAPSARSSTAGPRRSKPIPVVRGSDPSSPHHLSAAAGSGALSSDDRDFRGIASWQLGGGSQLHANLGYLSNLLPHKAWLDGAPRASMEK